MILGWPQIIFLAWLLVSFAFQLSMNGRPMTGAHNAGVTLVKISLMLGLLWWGGFFGWRA